MSIQISKSLSELFQYFFLFTLMVLNWGCGPSVPYTEEITSNLPKKISFNYHIRPILTDRCFSCHGPDEAARKADLRLDEADFAYATLENGRQPIHPGKLNKSEIFHRIYSNDPSLQMPPPESHLELSEYEKALLTTWMEQGAVYEPHWSFVPVKQPELPKVNQPETTQNEIDHFVLAKLEKEGWAFSPKAEKERLLRRISFDLTGLPPSLSEIDAFLKDDSPNAFEKVVDRLLASDAYAERMTQDWLDLARYADSQGLHSDGWRSMYPWRDWVIKAFQNNMPYDQFLTWQLAGDLLPEPSREQLIATGFNRNHKTTAEGGVVDEEYRAEYVHDRVATTATAFMGLTMECARCHDHKYDPISQKDYYQFYAFFNQVDEIGMSGDDGNAGPNLLLPSPETELRLREIEAAIQEKQSALTLSAKELAEQTDFIENLNVAALSRGSQAAVYLPFNGLGQEQVDQHPSSKFYGEPEIVTDERGKVLELNAEYEFVELKDQGLFEQYEPFSAAIWIHPNGQTSAQTIIGNSAQKGTFWRGWDLMLDSLNRLSLRLINALPHDALAVYTTESIPVGQWTHVAFAYDGSGKASGAQLYVNGQKAVQKVLYDRLQRSIYPMAFNKSRTDRSLRLGKSYRAFTGEYGIYAGKLDEFNLYNRQISDLEVAILAGKTTLKSQVENYQRTQDTNTAKALANTWWLQHPPNSTQKLSELRKAHQALLDTVPEVMIIEEVKTPRPTFVLNRGNYDEPTIAVKPGTPEKIFPFTTDFAKNRLGLAKWLLHRDHPLTSRVVVNRIWQQFFGNGFVTTPHDFGLQGSLPTHPELLDWLAANLMANGWDVKALQKQIVLSATYQQSSVAAAEIRKKDPDNLLLSRGPSYRLPGEMIRDNALAAAGILNSKIGGPSVKPIQPLGLWAEKTSSTHILRKYEPDTGSTQYRRSIYTFVRRTSPHPAMTAFDVPNRSVCIAQRQQTNTPMQALVLLNDPQFVEASRCLSQDVMQDKDALEDQINLAYRRLIGKRPAANQMESLRQLFQEELDRFSANQELADQYVNIGAYPIDESLEKPTLAAMTVVVNTIMNFDEFYMKR